MVIGVGEGAAELGQAHPERFGELGAVRKAIVAVASEAAVDRVGETAGKSAEQRQGGGCRESDLLERADVRVGGERASR